MEGPHIQVASTGARLALLPEVTTVGRGKHVDIRLADPSVSLLHAEIVRRGPYVYVMDMGLSRNGTSVNGRLVARRAFRLHAGRHPRRAGQGDENPLSIRSGVNPPRPLADLKCRYDSIGGSVDYRHITRALIADINVIVPRCGTD